MGAAQEPPTALAIRVDLDMQMDVVVDEMLAQEAEVFAGAVVAAVFGAIEFELALAGEALAVLRRGVEHGNGVERRSLPQAARRAPPEGDGNPSGRVMPRSVKAPRRRWFGVPSVQAPIFSAAPATNCAVGWRPTGLIWSRKVISSMHSFLAPGLRVAAWISSSSTWMSFGGRGTGAGHGVCGRSWDGPRMDGEGESGKA